MNYIVPDAVINVEFYGSEPVGIELPVTVDLTVEDTAPGIKGATASAQVKPARLETGLVVQVPPFVNHRRQGAGEHGHRGIPVESVDSRRTGCRLAAFLRYMDINQTRPGLGWIEVIAGSMFSGKSEELIRRLRRAQIARRKVQIFKPKIDDRYSHDHIISHSDMRIASETVAIVAGAAGEACIRRRRWSASTRGSSSTRSCRRSAAPSRIRASA